MYFSKRRAQVLLIRTDGRMDRFLEASHLYEVSVRKLADTPRRGRKTVETPLSKLLLVNSVVSKIRDEFTDSRPSGGETETYSDISSESRLMAAMTQSPSAMEVDTPVPASPLHMSSGRAKKHPSELSLDLVIHSNPVLSEILDDSRPLAKEAEVSFDMDTCEGDERSATGLTHRQCMPTGRGHAPDVDSSPFWHMLRKREHGCDVEEKENWSLLSESKRLKTGDIKSLWGMERDSLRPIQVNDAGTVWRQKHSDHHNFKPSVTELPFSLFSSVWSPGSLSSPDGSQWNSVLCAY